MVLRYNQKVLKIGKNKALFNGFGEFLATKFIHFSGVISFHNFIYGN